MWNNLLYYHNSICKSLNHRLRHSAEALCIFPGQTFNIWNKKWNITSDMNGFWVLCIINSSKSDDSCHLTWDIYQIFLPDFISSKIYVDELMQYNTSVKVTHLRAIDLFYYSQWAAPNPLSHPWPPPSLLYIINYSNLYWRPGTLELIQGLITCQRGVETGVVWICSSHLVFTCH